MVGYEPDEKELIEIARRMLGNWIAFLDETADIIIKVNGIKYRVKVGKNGEIKVVKKG